MSLRETILRQRLIINKLRKYTATFNEIADYLAHESKIQSYDFNVSNRTFTRDLEDIRSIYGIDIQYDFSRKVYYIDEDGQPEVNERIIEAFDLFNALNISDQLSSHIHFEKRKPAGTENLYSLLHAIKNRLQIRFSYQKFWEDEITQRTVKPCALKEFKNRWYMLSKDQKDNSLKTFALDRMSNLEITNIYFVLPEDFSIEENFRHCFGIICPNYQNPQKIILSFEPIQGKYIKSLPLHASQKILVDNTEELRIELTLFITYDLVKELLSFGEYVKILSPDSLIDEIKKNLNESLSHYK